jgi:methylated-DNA-protein-cysteine methyltransferase related protein
VIGPPKSVIGMAETGDRHGSEMGDRHESETTDRHGPKNAPYSNPLFGNMSAMNRNKRFYSVIRRIPKGRVATYGQIARLAGLPAHARQVGYALAVLSDGEVPWHRVVNSKGEISQRSYPGYEDKQRALLEREGIVFDGRSRLSLRRYGWNPRQ